MAPQTTPSSSSSARTGDMKMNDNNPSLEPRIDLNYFMTQLCAIAQVPTDGYDICGESFGESFLKHLREKEERWHEGKGLVDAIFINIATPRPFQYKTQATKPPPEFHSYNHEKSSELSQTRPSENNEFDVDDPFSPEVIVIPPSPLRITSPHPSPATSCTSYGTFYDTPPVSTVEDTPQIEDVYNHDNSPTSPKLPREAYQIVLPTTADNVRQPQSSKLHEIVILSGDDDNFIENSSPSPPSSSLRQLRPKNKEARKYNDHSDSEDTSPRNSKKRNKRADRKSMHHAPRNDLQCICSSENFSTKQARNRHINRYTTEWKFKCTECQKKFYTLPALKTHMKNKHKNTTLEQSVSINQKKHKFARALVNKSSRLLGMPHLSPAMSPRGFMFSPRRPGMSPRRPQPWMTPSRQKYSMFMPSVLPLSSQSSGHIELSDEDEDTHQGAMNSGKVDISQGFSDKTSYKKSGKLYGCFVCSQVFPNDLVMLRNHLTTQHNIEGSKVKCGKCQQIFGSCKTFHQHWDAAHHEIVY